VTRLTLAVDCRLSDASVDVEVGVVAVAVNVAVVVVTMRSQVGS
jgi:hypothetical protein